MVKEPRAGRVKTRLGQDIGMPEAAWWFRHQSARLLRRLDDPRWRLVLAVSPDREGLTSRQWPARFARMAQGHGSLGDRMGRILRSGRGPLCIIGADIPDVTRSQIAHAFHTLGSHEAALGPATDGGYWLVGLKRTAPPPARLFEGVRWSTPHAMADTAATMRGLRIATVATLSDVDTADDLRSRKRAGSQNIA
jgi:rSAM/selenodomain-associated transferase 1